MNEKERSYFSEEDIDGALDRFRNSLISGRQRYFDVSEFEAIVEQLMDEGDINNSEIAALQGIQIHPDAIPLQLKYSQVLLNKGMYQKAMQYLDVAEKVEENNPDVHLLKGSACLILGEDQNAERSFVKAVKTAEGEEDDILYHIGSAYVQAGEIRKAIGYFEKAVLANPKNEAALYELGYFCDQQGDFIKSTEYYNQYLDINPFSHSTWFNLGISYNKAGEHMKAIEAYEYAILLNENFNQALFNIGNAYANAGKYNDAISKYQEFLRLEPENDDAFCYIGECYLNLESYSKAEKNYLKSVKLNPENDSAWFGIALIKWLDKKYEESISFIKKAIKIDAQNSEYWLTMGKVYTDNKQFADAEKAMKKAASIDPDNSEIWLIYAEMYNRFDLPDKEVNILKQAIRKNQDVLLKYRMAGILFSQRQYNEAELWLIESMEQDFMQINYLFEMYPKVVKTKRFNKIVDEYRKLNNLKQK